MYNRPVYTRKKYARQSNTILVLLVLIVISIGVHFNGCTSEGRFAGFDFNDTLEVSSLTSRYKKIQDSMNSVDAAHKAIAGNKGDALTVGPSGVSVISNRLDFDDQIIDLGTDYFFTLPYYHLSGNAAFVIDGKKYILQTLVLDSFRNKIRYNHMVTREIDTRFVRDYSEESRGSSVTKGLVYIKIDKGLYQVVKVLHYIIAGVVLILSFYFFIMVPFGILKRISKSDFFNKDTVPELLSFSYFLIGLWIVNFLGGALLYLTMRVSNTIPKEFKFSWYEVLTENRFLLIAGLIVLMLAQAFKRGYELQLELAASGANKSK